MTLADIEKLDKEFLSAEDVAAVLGADPQTIRSQASSDITMLGFPAIKTGARLHIPKQGFLYYCRYGRPVQA